MQTIFVQTRSIKNFSVGVEYHTAGVFNYSLVINSTSLQYRKIRRGIMFSPIEPEIFQKNKEMKTRKEECKQITFYDVKEIC